MGCAPARAPVGDNDRVSSTESSNDAATGPDLDPLPRPLRVWVFSAVTVFVLAADILSKVLVASQLGDGHQVRLLGGALYLVETRNSGAAFSVGTGATFLLTGVAVVIAAVIVRVARRLHSVAWAVALGLILGGALGNLVDRLFRAPGFGRGHVVDWISVFSSDGRIWPIFNLADSSICCGAVLAALIALLGIDIDGHRKR